MNKTEQKAFNRLVAENAQLKVAVENHLKIYSDQVWKIIDMYTKLELINEAMNQDEQQEYK